MGTKYAKMKSTFLWIKKKLYVILIKIDCFHKSSVTVLRRLNTTMFETYVGTCWMDVMRPLAPVRVVQDTIT